MPTKSTRTHTHTLRARDGHYVMELVLLKVYMDCVASRSPLMHWSGRSQAHPDSIAFLCWPKHILQYVCWLMDTMRDRGFHIAVEYQHDLLHVHPVIDYSYDAFGSAWNCRAAVYLSHTTDWLEIDVWPSTKLDLNVIVKCGWTHPDNKMALQ